MHRRLIPLTLLALFLVVIAAVAHGQDEAPGKAAQELLIVHEPPQQMIDGAATLPFATLTANSSSSPLFLSAEEPADLCEDAPLLLVTPEQNDGVVADVSDATEEASDPILSCMWGKPVRKKGYRTVWYKLVGPASGRINLDTFNSSYDTVISVYQGTCDDLQPIQCNDDSNGFTSETAVTIEEGEEYYVQIANWNAGLNPIPVLQLGAYLEPVNSRWDFITSKPATPAISRHAVVAQDNRVYVVGGQTGGEGLPQVSNQLLKFDTTSRRWESMQQIPGAGYSNTTAALLNNTIYLPSGYNGNNLGYDGLHWAYDISQDSWRTVASIPTPELPDGLPFAWASAVVPPAKTRYYLSGGMSSTVALAPTANVSAETYSYTPSSDSWIKLKPMQAGRYAHTAAWIESNNLGICVAGGLGVDTLADSGDPVTILHRSAECYQPGGAWQFVGDLNIPRFGAGSVVGPDGNWYVFGGMTVDGTGIRPVASTEVYNPRLRSWSVMDPSFNLGSYRSMPARFWPRGAMVGSDLWVMGGSIVEVGEEALPTIDRLYIPPRTVNFPMTIANYDDADRPDDSFVTARPMSLGGRQTRNFDQQRDFFDYYYFDLTSERRVTIDLEVPENNDFDLELYGQNKLLWGSSQTPLNGTDEMISLVLQPRRWFIRVLRAFPTEKPDKGAYYTLKLD